MNGQVLCDERSRLSLGRHQPVFKVVVIVFYFYVWFFLYDVVNRHVSDPARTVHLEAPREWIPHVIQPDTALVYVFGGALLPALPFLYYGSWSGIRFVLGCYTATSLLAFPCYLVGPCRWSDRSFRATASASG
jgi:hypothetical protein